MRQPPSIIDSRQLPVWLPWREMFAYKDLFRLLVRREVLTKYSQTLLGPIWFLLQPLLTTLVFWFVFSQTLKIETASVPPTLYYLSGLVVWGFLSQTVTQVSGSLQANASLFKKVYFPRLFIPLSHVVASLMVLFIQLLLFLIYYFAMMGIEKLVWSEVFYLPLALFQLILLSTGLGLFVAAMTVRYRDFHYLLSFFMTLWFLLTPIGYSVHQVPKVYLWLYSLNPLHPSLSLFRRFFFGTPAVNLLEWGQGLILALSIAFLGLYAFHRVEGDLVDRI